MYQGAGGKEDAKKKGVSSIFCTHDDAQGDGKCVRSNLTNLFSEDTGKKEKSEWDTENRVVFYSSGTLFFFYHYCLWSGYTTCSKYLTFSFIIID